MSKNESSKTSVKTGGILGALLPPTIYETTVTHKDGSKSTGTGLSPKSSAENARSGSGKK